MNEWRGSLLWVRVWALTELYSVSVCRGAREQNCRDVISDPLTDPALWDRFIKPHFSCALTSCDKCGSIWSISSYLLGSVLHRTFSASNCHLVNYLQHRCCLIEVSALCSQLWTLKGSFGGRLHHGAAPVTGWEAQLGSMLVCQTCVRVALIVFYIKFNFIQHIDSNLIFKQLCK